MTIATAIDKHENMAEDYDIIFEFLPKKSTLASLQQIHQNLLKTPLLISNFRRKITPLVEETDEFMKRAGRIPARLFKEEKNRLT